MRRQETGGAATDAPWPLEDRLTFMRALWRVAHALQKTSKRMSLELGVTGPQRLVLRVVGLSPGVSAGDLARVLHVHPSTLTGVLQRLTGQHLLQRVTDEADRRRSILRLTPAGARVNARRGGTVEHAVSRALARLNRRDRAATERALGLLAEALEYGGRPVRAARAAAAARSRSRKPS